MRNFFLTVLLGASSLASGQMYIADSLSALVKNHADEDTALVVLLNELSLRVFKNNPEQSKAYAERALQLSQRLAFRKGIAKAKHNLVSYHVLKGEIDVALALGLEVLEMTKQLQQPALLQWSNYALSAVYQIQPDHAKTLKYLREAYRMTGQIKSPLITCRIFNSLGVIAMYEKKYDSARMFYEKALSVIKTSGERENMPEVLTNLGVLYSRWNKDALSMVYTFSSLEAAQKNGNRILESTALMSIGYIKLIEKKYAEAEKFFLESLRLCKMLGRVKGQSENYIALIDLKNQTGKFSESHMYMREYYKLKDSLLNATKTKQIAELEIRYQTREKEHAIQLLERDKRIQKLWTNLLIASLLLLAMASIFTYYHQRYRERKNRQIMNLEIEQLTSQHNELSEKYKNVLLTGDESPVDSQDQRLLKKAIEVVEQNMHDPLFSVEVMAREMGMSRTNMHRKIKAITGFPPSELIRSIRLRKAAVLLLNQVNSVSQISLTVGFEDHSYFSKAFKKQFGVPPSEYLQSSQVRG